MLFNSPTFLLFLPLVFAAYWAMNRWTGERGGLRAQNLLLLSSCVFYGWWDWRFLGLIARCGRTANSNLVIRMAAPRILIWTAKRRLDFSYIGLR